MIFKRGEMYGYSMWMGVLVTTWMSIILLEDDEMHDVCMLLSETCGEGVMWICCSQDGGEVVGFVWAKWQLDIDLRYLYAGLW